MRIPKLNKKRIFEFLDNVLTFLCFAIFFPLVAICLIIGGAIGMHQGYTAGLLVLSMGIVIVALYVAYYLETTGSRENAKGTSSE